VDDDPGDERPVDDEPGLPLGRRVPGPPLRPAWPGPGSRVRSGTPAHDRDACPW